jgi:PAT family beta-lactamase induction signal transducer AmpG
MAYHSPLGAGLSPPLEQFGYGLGFTVFTVYLMLPQTVGTRHPLRHLHRYNGLRYDVLGMISGAVQKSVGYGIFFIMVCIMTIPGILTIPFILKQAENKSA